MKIIFLTQNFRQGFGGEPETVRLMARQFAQAGISSDVFDKGIVHHNVEGFSLLPKTRKTDPAATLESLEEYDVIIQTGPWHNPIRLWRLLSMRTGQPYYYRPSGGLARIEFSRFRDLKKPPYFFLIEQWFLKKCDAIIFTSKMEQKETISPVRHMKDEFIIPCVIDLPPHSIKATKPRVPNSKITFSFLAEISPRKGLRELVEAFTRWTVQNKLTDKVRLAIGGSARPGSARYLTRTQSIACSHPNVEIEFKGAIPHADRGDFYGCTDIFVAPSRFESFGRTIPEALLEGCTILSAPNLGALEYFPENDCITVAQSATTDDLVAGLDKAYACFINQGSGVRSLTTKFAWETIRNINAQAQAAWLELLSR